MRCPKCHYISFGSDERCRNCGYEFALAPETPPDDLPIHPADQPIGPYQDFFLSEGSAAPGAAAPESGSKAAPRRQPSGRFDLPLFSDRDVADDMPLVSPSAVPRPPLSVRRGQPAAGRARPEPLPAEGEEEASDDIVERAEADTDETFERLRDAVRSRSEEQREAKQTETLAPASIVARLFAGFVDVVILVAIDAAVLYSTLRVLELPVADIRVLPVVPMTLFLALLNGGYLSAFTAAGGQTIGKMIARIRVVAEPDVDQDGHADFHDGGRPVTLGASVLRAAAYLASLLPAGLGFLPILIASDRRALHDRLANTRVVKA